MQVPLVGFLGRRDAATARVPILTLRSGAFPTFGEIRMLICVEEG
jgi:hypothetical protein